MWSSNDRQFEDGRRQVVRFPVVLTYHVFEKLRSIDMVLAEFDRVRA